MAINYTEMIVHNHIRSKGGEITKCNQFGYPDFKVFNFDTKEYYYLEVKKKPITYTKKQKEMFPKIKHPIRIAEVGDGVIRFIDYHTKEDIEKIPYYKRKMVEPNIKCNKCDYRWHTTSNALYVSCPSCMQKTKQEVKTDE